MKKKLQIKVVHNLQLEHVRNLPVTNNPSLWSQISLKILVETSPYTTVNHQKHCPCNKQLVSSKKLPVHICSPRTTTCLWKTNPKSTTNRTPHHSDWKPRVDPPKLYACADVIQLCRSNIHIHRLLAPAILERAVVNHMTPWKRPGRIAG